MKKLGAVVFMIFLTINFGISQEYKGKGRMQGSVYDEKGNPLEGVKVKLFSVKTQSGFETVTDSKGKWKASWIRGGTWNIDFEKVGYETKKISADISGLRRNPPIITKIKEMPNRKEMKGFVVAEEIKEDLTKGNKLYDEEKYEEAKIVYEGILEKHSDAYIINISLGNCYFQQERYDQAEEFYQKVLEIDPKNYEALIGIGNGYANLGESEKSLEWYRRIEFEKINDPNVLFNIGAIYYDNSQYKEALKYYKRALEIHENFTDAIYQLGLVYLALGNNQDALIEFENYLRHDTDSERASQVKGFIEYLMKKDENKKKA